MKVILYEKYLKVVDSLEEEIDVLWKQNLPWEEYCRLVKPLAKRLDEEKIKALEFLPENLEPKDNYGDYFTIKSYLENVEAGGFMDSDGCSVFCIGDKMTNISATPSFVLKYKDCIPSKFDGVMWYNK